MEDGFNVLEPFLGCLRHVNIQQHKPWPRREAIVGGADRIAASQIRAIRTMERANDAPIDAADAYNQKVTGLVTADSRERNVAATTVQGVRCK